MIFSADPLVKVGRIVRPHGYEGKLRIEIDISTEIDLKEPIFLMFQEKPVPFFIEEFSGSNPFIVRIDDINSIEGASELVGKEIYFQMEGELEEDDSDLIGYLVTDAILGHLGPVSEIVHNSAQDLLIVRHNNKEHMIPFVEDLILSIDDEQKLIEVNLPEGLLELD